MTFCPIPYYSALSFIKTQKNMSEKGNFGIVVSGGPAPGINSVIASVVVCAERAGYKTIGFSGGFRGLVEADPKNIKELNSDRVAPIANTGGSILRTSRYNPLKEEDRKQSLIANLRANKVDKLVVIGGEGSAWVSHQLSEAYPAVRIAHIPKTIDNDLILPNKHPSFGFETARYAGTKIMRTLMAEAQTTSRWFVVRTMGRKAGFLALGLGIASGAHLTLIGEQFDENSLTPKSIAEIIMKSVQKRIQEGYPWGTCILAEGIIDKFDPERVADLDDCPRDEVGRILLSEVRLEDLVAKELKKLEVQAGLNMRFTPENIGYALRCREPISFDIEYTQFLGYGAVKYLLEGLGGFMVVRDFDNLAYVPLSSMIDVNGSIKSRQVDLNSHIYQAARTLMLGS